MSSDFEDRIDELKGKVSQLKNILQTEEGTKKTLVMSEFTADQGIKKGEKSSPTHVVQLCPRLWESCRSSVLADDIQDQFYTDLAAST